MQAPLAGYPPAAVDIHIAALPLGKIVGQQTDAVGIDAAEVGSHQRVRNQLADVPRSTSRRGQLTAERPQFVSVNESHKITITASVLHDAL